MTERQKINPLVQAFSLHIHIAGKMPVPQWGIAREKNQFMLPDRQEWVDSVKDGTAMNGS